MQEKISLVNNRDILFSKSLLILNILAIIVYFICLIYTIYLFINTDDYLSITKRNHFIYLSYIPLILFNYSFWVYESLYPNRQFSYNTFYKLFVFILYLSIPSFILIFRYKIDLNQIKDSYKTLGLLLFLISPFLINSFFKIKIGSAILDICFRPWSNNLEPLKTKYFNSKDIESKRDKHYLDKINLDVFQSSFLKSTVEHIVVSEHIKLTSFLYRRRKLNVLDIGGHNGFFTSKFLSAIGKKISEIEMVDPVFNSDYKKNLKEITNKITIKKELFENYNPLTQKTFDLIVASHSLYYFLDTKANHNLIINKIKKLLASNGLAVIILGSIKSPAYSLKSAIIEFMLNEKNQDSSAESLIETVQSDSELNYTVLNIDNFIDMSEILADNDRLCNWISYFTRTPKIINEYDLVQIRKMIYYYSVEGNHLPEQCSGSVLSENEYILHKTKAILISTVANNVYKK